MRKVIDSNFLRSPDLRQFLSSPRNFAVLTDYVAIEAYKSSSIATVYQSMEILAERPHQVLVLRGTAFACGMRGRRSGLQKRLIDQMQTSEFSEYCRFLKLARAGDQRLERKLLRLGIVAREQMERVLQGATQMLGALGDILSDYSEVELAAIRSGGPLPQKVLEKLQRQIAQTSEAMFASHPNVQRRPSMDEYPHTFIFRTAMCSVLWALRWVAEGGQLNMKPEKLRNDIVDMNFAVFASYFDGVLSNDRRLNEMYRGLTTVLYRVYPEARPS